jgi:acetate kinase
VKILVSNLGSTSFKYRLFELDGGAETLLAKGGYERVEDFGPVIEDCIKVLSEQGHLKGADDLDAVGFKTVLGKNLSGCVEADDKVLEALAGFDAVPENWYELGVRRYGFHGASHKFVAERSAQLLGRDDVADKVQRLYQKGDTPVDKPLRVVSCHLGGSSSITGIRNGVAIGSSMGFSPQGGVPQNNRVGDLDAMAVPYMLKVGGLSIGEIERQMTKEGGLLGLSGVSNDLRDILEVAAAGNERAKLALDVLVHSIRQWAGSFFWQMGGIEAIAFTGGIGENNSFLRAAVCAGLEPFGLKLDKTANDSLKGEGTFTTDDATIKGLVIPANEELVVAREVYRFMQARLAPAS